MEDLEPDESAEERFEKERDIMRRKREREANPFARDTKRDEEERGHLPLTNSEGTFKKNTVQTKC